MSWTEVPPATLAEEILPDASRIVALFTETGANPSRLRSAFEDRAADADVPFVIVPLGPEDADVRERYGLATLPAVAVFEDGTVAHRMAGQVGEVHLDTLLAGVEAAPGEEG